MENLKGTYSNSNNVRRVLFLLALISLAAIATAKDVGFTRFKTDLNVDGNAYFPNIGTGCLQLTNGKVVTTGTNCGSGSGGGGTYTSGTPATIQVTADTNQILQNFDGNFNSRLKTPFDNNFNSMLSSRVPWADGNIADDITAINYVRSAIFNAFYPVVDGNIANSTRFLQDASCDLNASCTITGNLKPVNKDVNLDGNVGFGGVKYNFPRVFGNNNQVLTTDAVGNLSWQSVSAAASTDTNTITAGFTNNVGAWIITLVANGDLNVTKKADINNIFLTGSGDSRAQIGLFGRANDAGNWTADAPQAYLIDGNDGALNFKYASGLSAGDPITYSTGLSIAQSGDVSIPNGNIINASPAEAGNVYYVGGSGQLAQTSTLFFNDSTVRLGINTTTPTRKLSVNGDANLDGNVAFGGVQFNFPRVYGTNNQVLKTDAVGNLSWTDQTGGGGTDTNTVTAGWTNNAGQWQIDLNVAATTNANLLQVNRGNLGVGIRMIPTVAGLDVNGVIAVSGAASVTGQISGQGGINSTGSNTTSSALVGNATTRYAVASNTSAATSAANNVITGFFVSVPQTEGTSGEHPLYTSLGIAAGNLTNGTATTRSASTVYVQGAPYGSATITNPPYAMWIDDLNGQGTVRLDGNMIIGCSGDANTVNTGCMPIARFDVNGTIHNLGDQNFDGNTAFGGVEFAFPRTQSSGSQVLSNDGVGNLSWISASGSPADGNGAVQFNLSSGFGGNASQFFWDSFNSRLGIGTATPANKVTIIGDLNVSPSASTRAGLIVEDTADANVGIGVSNPVTKLQVGGLTNANTLYIDTIANEVGINRIPTTALDVNGAISATGTVTTGSLSANGSATVSQASSTTSSFALIGGVSNTTVGIYAGQSTVTLGANNDGFRLFAAGGAFTEGSSGRHPIIAALGVGKPRINAGNATVANTAALYVEDNNSSTVVTGGNWQLWADGNGASRIDGSLLLGWSGDANSDNTVNTSNYKLDVNGAARVQSDLNAAQLVYFPTITNSAQSNALCWNATTGEVTENSGVTTCLASARRYKENIITLSDSGLAIVEKMRPVQYNLKADATKKKQVGFIAEEVAEVDPRLAAIAPDGTVNGVNYEQYTAVLTKAIQELYEQNKKLEARINELEAKK